MSLVVSAFWTDPATGEWHTFVDWDDGSYMAGGERARWNLWGSEAVRRRGATFLPQLADSDMWVGPDELAAFVAEVRALQADVDGLCAELGFRCSGSISGWGCRLWCRFLWVWPSATGWRRSGAEVPSRSRRHRRPEGPKSFSRNMAQPVPPAAELDVRKRRASWMARWLAVLLSLPSLLVVAFG